MSFSDNKGLRPEVREELLRLQTEEGSLRPDDVVYAARDPDSILHTLFEWDDTLAAEKYRKNQARRLIRDVYVEHVVGQRIIPTRAFVHNETAGREPEYQSIQVVKDDRDKVRQTLLANLRRSVGHVTSVINQADYMGMNVDDLRTAQTLLDDYVQTLVSSPELVMTKRKKGKRKK